MSIDLKQVIESDGKIKYRLFINGKHFVFYSKEEALSQIEFERALEQMHDSLGLADDEELPEEIIKAFIEKLSDHSMKISVEIILDGIPRGNTPR